MWIVHAAIVRVACKKRWYEREALPLEVPTETAAEIGLRRYVWPSPYFSVLRAYWLKSATYAEEKAERLARVVALSYRDALAAPGAAGWTCLYPAGTSKCDGSTGAEEKFDVVICVSIRIALVGCPWAELPFWSELLSGGLSFFLPKPKWPGIIEERPALAT